MKDMEHKVKNKLKIVKCCDIINRIKFLEFFWFAILTSILVFRSRKKTVLACDGLLSAEMFIFNGYCAILVGWMLTTSFLCYAANINPKMLDSRVHVSINHSVNITRNHDGDIIIVKGKLKKSDLLIESKSSFVVSLASWLFKNLLEIHAWTT